jgi:hypothetical protein
MDHKSHSVHSKADGVRNRKPFKTKKPLTGRQQVVSLKRRTVGSFHQHPDMRKCLDLLNAFSGVECKEPDYKMFKSPAVLGMIRSMFGQGVYNFRLGYGGGSTGSFFTATGTTNVLAVARSLYLDMTSATDWTALNGLFDEFLWEESQYHLVPISAGFNTASPAMTALAFDDDGLSSAPSSYDTMTAYSNSRYLCPAVQGATLATEANSTGFHPFVFSCKRQYHVADNAPVINAPGTGWIDIGTPANLLGSFLLFNFNVSASNNVAVYQYVAVMTVKFRCRR